MARKPVPPDTQTSVLVKSRRRCCICFGLNRDTDLKAGQIAHLDHDRDNNNEDNLAFLCFDHHDEYDSRTSQRKGFTAGEVKQFRAELHDSIGKAFSVSVHFGAVTVPKEDPYAGQYIRLGTDDDSAEIELTPIPDNTTGEPRYAVTGFALWGARREYGPNMGELSFVSSLIDGAIEHFEPRPGSDESHMIRLTFRDGTLIVEEKNFVGVYGMNVTFIGEYRRA